MGFFDRFPDKADYDGLAKLIEWYGDKYPRLRKQWEDRRKLYELGQSINVDM